MEQQLVLDISLNELNIILVALSEQPYKNVVGLIQKLREQGIDQTTKSGPAE